MRTVQAEPDLECNSMCGAVRVWRKSARWNWQAPRRGMSIFASSWSTRPPSTASFIVSRYPDGSRAFVACTPDNYVAVIDLKTMEMVGKLDAGGGPDGMAWAVRR